METTSAPTLFTASPATGNWQPVTIKTITWATNFNNKLGCEAMVHIDLAPFKKPVRSELEATMIEIYTADQSHPPVKARLFDLLFVQLRKVSCLMTLPSHGMDEVQFARYMLDRYPDKLSLDSEVVVYYYKKA